ncbi:3-alpha,7-alpha,12-alpha-trihydroxy-5-beta-cholest-24-enoyl-CoA hydratase [Mesorhizobium microcysteis]|uniref:3-alpha,7-alpha, 12-alpha-trihydroxy-5-beta-cholest-24-enoyl-CoA hydratase n=1 Tax=Neoaquamicrobium microcysteis TaxID=2682781 RepID=A0A5D4GZE5_9HYPH|nr:MaoC/PaaZ C-terminal domain-containing protein [Mesorhizobium microcysteis]TYR33393.1 3-alpha,7-alpha,12-alpha-trihydroxy-5-beta-cholest-24-enoyl-CoA hydratase [Mesorhizobium microcysteis]
MAFDAERLGRHRFAPVEQQYSERDAILYALGVGLPGDPLDAGDLAFLLEDRLKVLPTYAATLATLGMWVRDPSFGIDWVRLLHSAQAATFHAPLPRAAKVRAEARIRSLHDRGVEKGAVCVVERRISDAATRESYCTVEQTLILRGNGGFGGDAPPRVEPRHLPGRAPDAVAQVAVSPRAALIYRLSGDLNPLHADPEVARKAGFDRPILHGLASYGIAGAQILKHFCGDDPMRLKSLSMRFSGVVMPGDRIDFSMWREGDAVLFEAKTGPRTVLDQGFALVDDGS